MNMTLKERFEAIERRLQKLEKKDKPKAKAKAKAKDKA